MELREQVSDIVLLLYAHAQLRRLLYFGLTEIAINNTFVNKAMFITMFDNKNLTISISYNTIDKYLEDC